MDEPLWVVAYECGTQESCGAAGFDWFPTEHLTDALAACDSLVVGFAPEAVTVYFVEYYPATAYSIDQKVRGIITDEIDDEIWEVLPDDRPAA